MRASQLFSSLLACKQTNIRPWNSLISIASKVCCTGVTVPSLLETTAATIDQGCDVFTALTTEPILRQGKQPTDLGRNLITIVVGCSVVRDIALPSECDPDSVPACLQWCLGDESMLLEHNIHAAPSREGLGSLCN